jgi:hypothetical protein
MLEMHNHDQRSDGPSRAGPKRFCSGQRRPRITIGGGGRGHQKRREQPPISVGFALFSDRAVIAEIGAFSAVELWSISSARTWPWSISSVCSLVGVTLYGTGVGSSKSVR